MYKNLAAALAAACFFSPVFSQTPPKTSAGPVKAGFVYVSPITEAGWTRQHEEGRKAVEAALGSGVQATFVENVAEGADAERVIRDLAATGHQIIFTPSFGYMEPTLKVAQDYPQVKFESITGYKTAPNVASANARYYEGRYLAGIAAGRMSKTGVAGFVAGFPIPEVLQGINAFTLGMRSVNPQATVKVVWLNVWFDPPKERDAAMALFNQDVDVIAFHTGSTAVMAAAQERGKMAVAYHSDMRRVGPDAQIVAVTH
ncbi:MAG: BMP family ABC transporter substrate-binding protein, partial [Simplicispira sp.]|nr:BMP family ABC transporter substrate-binding protein [Simplicispira sp.]